MTEIETELLHALLRLSGRVAALGYHIEAPYQDDLFQIAIAIIGPVKFAIHVDPAVNQSREAVEYRRDSLLQLAGWRPLHFTAGRESADECASEILAHLALNPTR